MMQESPTTDPPASMDPPKSTEPPTSMDPPTTMEPPTTMDPPGSMDPPASDAEVNSATLEEVKEEGPMFPCNLFDAEMVHKIAQEFLTGLSSACVDNTTGGIFKSPASVAVDIRREMVDYLVQRSETFVAESVVMEGGPNAEAPTDAFDIISDIIDDFAHSKRNFFSRVSGWVLSDRREDRIDDFVQEMETNGFWLIGRRESVAQTLLRNVDFKNAYHCSMKFRSEEELQQHLPSCNFRVVNCENEGCNAIFIAGRADQHDSSCPFKIIPCEQKCPDTIMRRDMDRHCITVCPMKLVNCPFYPVGCQSTVPQCNIAEHRAENLQAHLVCILKLVHKEASSDALNKRAEQLMEASPRAKLAAARDARALTFVIKDLEAKLGPIIEEVKPPIAEEENSTANNEESAAESTGNDKDAESTTLKTEDSQKSPTKQDDLVPSDNKVEPNESLVKDENGPEPPSENEEATKKESDTEVSKSIETEEKSADLAAKGDDAGVMSPKEEHNGSTTDLPREVESVESPAKAEKESLEATIKDEEEPTVQKTLESPKEEENHEEQTTVVHSEKENTPVESPKEEENLKEQTSEN